MVVENANGLRLSSSSHNQGLNRFKLASAELQITHHPPIAPPLSMVRSGPNDRIVGRSDMAAFSAQRERSHRWWGAPAGLDDVVQDCPLRFDCSAAHS
mmetsp:Transcript_42127/g.136348  ORF Transcript_42127/g.136348 Transcript_42127/m.136348 type:complete len:98 (-) Transcript_42127:2077-2370(-)